MLEGKKGIVLGLANDKSIAFAVANKMTECGAQVIATCLNEKAYEALQQFTKDLNIDLQICNVDNEGELENFIDYSQNKLGNFDFVVHSIAWAPLDDLHGRVIDSSKNGFSRAIGVSCHSFARLAKLSSIYMTNGGSLVTMTYLGADEVVPHYGLMGPVKAALESLVRYMSNELGCQSIRVHAISPGPILTRASSGIDSFEDLMADAVKRAPLKRLVTLDEIANLTMFLCSDLSTGMTGQTIYVDAGYHAMA